MATRVGGCSQVALKVRVVGRYFSLIFSFYRPPWCCQNDALTGGGGNKDLSGTHKLEGSLELTTD